MRDPALIAEGASHRSGTDALHARAFVTERVLDVEIVDVHIQPFFLAHVVGVLNGRAQQLVHVGGDPLVGEGQRVERIFDAAALDHVEHQPRLLRADSGESGLSCEFHNGVL
jgi:hypothetical protein